MKLEKPDLEIIVPAPRDAQRQIERLQQHSIVELEAVRQFHQ
jgi:hypothetical protein